MGDRVSRRSLCTEEGRTPEVLRPKLDFQFFHLYKSHFFSEPVFLTCKMETRTSIHRKVLCKLGKSLQTWRDFLLLLFCLLDPRSSILFFPYCCCFYVGLQWCVIAYLCWTTCKKTEQAWCSKRRGSANVSSLESFPILGFQ